MQRTSGTPSPQNKPGCHTRRRPKSKKAATCVLAWAAAFIIVCGFCHIYFCSFKRFFAHSQYLHTASRQRKRFLHPTVTARKEDGHIRRRSKSKKSRNSCIRRGLRLLFIIPGCPATSQTRRKNPWGLFCFRAGSVLKDCAVF